jgi:probable O-glycosylation ligase (exosortase A-associated)
MSENNTLAMALLMGLPFVWYSRELITQAWIKTGILIVVFTTMAAVIMTESRGGILTLGVLCLIFVYRSRHKLLILAVVVLCVVPVILLVQDRFVARMSTLANVEEDNSASSRMRYQVAALKLWKDYPLFGVGYGTLNWVAMSPRYLGTSNEGQHVIHNNYLQMATDSGTFAFLILMWQIFYSLWWLNGTAKRLKETHPGLTALPRAMEGSLIAFAVDSTFTSRTDYDFYYFLILMVGAWYTVYNTDLPATESAPARQPVVAPAVKIGPSVPAPAAVLAEQRRLRTPSSPLRSRGNQG